MKKEKEKGGGRGVINKNTSEYWESLMELSKTQKQGEEGEEGGGQIIY